MPVLPLQTETAQKQRRNEVIYETGKTDDLRVGAL